MKLDFVIAYIPASISLKHFPGENIFMLIPLEWMHVQRTSNEKSHIFGISILPTTRMRSASCVVLSSEWNPGGATLDLVYLTYHHVHVSDLDGIFSTGKPRSTLTDCIKVLAPRCPIFNAFQLRSSLLVSLMTWYSRGHTTWASVSL